MEPSNKYCLSTNGSMEKQGQYINHIQPTQESNKVYVFEVVLGKDGLENDLCTHNIIKV